MAGRDEGKRVLQNGNNPRRKQNRPRDRVRLSFLRAFRREVSFAEGQAFARKYNLMFFETSAKIAINVEDAFLSTAKLILENIERNEYDLTNEVRHP